MSDELKQNLSRRSTWIRVAYMVLFALIFGIAEFVVLVIAVVQIIGRLTTGKVNVELRTLGDRIGRYLHEIVAYQTFNTEERPYPFAPFPGRKTTTMPTEDSYSPG